MPPDGAAGPWLDHAVRSLERGDLIIFPTDTLYALGGRAESAEAVERLRHFKERDEGKPLPVVAADIGQARRLVAAWPPLAVVLAEAFWPGPLTLVLPVAAGLPAGLTAGRGTLGVRVPALAACRALCAAAGPLVATSANRAGRSAPLTADEAVREVGGAVTLVLDAGPGQPLPSTVLDLSTEPPCLVREGAVGRAAIVRLTGRVIAP